MIIGIDLGTNFTSAAFLDNQGMPVLCPDSRNPDSF